MTKTLTLSRETALTVPTDPVSQTLLAAAIFLRERGLAKCERQSADGSLCLHGAIAFARHGDADNSTGDVVQEAELRVYQYLKATGVSDRLVMPAGCAAWNNLSERTVDEVAAALEAAAFVQ